MLTKEILVWRTRSGGQLADLGIHRAQEGATCTRCREWEKVRASPMRFFLTDFPEEDLWSGDRETFGRWMRWWFAGGPEVDREITERFGA